MITYLLAAGVGDVLPVLFVLIAIASGIINYFREKSAAQQAQQGQQRRPPGRRDEAVDSEIEMFLEEVAGPDDRERRPQRKRSRRPQGDRTNRQRKKREAEPQAPAARESVADRHMERAEPSTVGQRHVKSHVGQRHIHSSVEERHLDGAAESDSASIRSRSGRTGKPTPIMQMFRNAGGVRTAIVLNEILSPPPGRRNRS